MRPFPSAFSPPPAPRQGPEPHAGCPAPSGQTQQGARAAPPPWGVFLAGDSPSSHLSRQIISRYFGEAAELPAGAHVGGKKALGQKRQSWCPVSGLPPSSSSVTSGESTGGNGRAQPGPVGPHLPQNAVNGNWEMPFFFFFPSFLRTKPTSKRPGRNSRFDCRAARQPLTAPCPA